jgi:hypothetical protein
MNLIQASKVRLGAMSPALASSKVMLGAAVGDESTGDLPRSTVKIADTAQAHAASAALRG